MYTISVEPLSDTKPRMSPDGHDENRHSDFKTTACVQGGNGKLRTIQSNPILQGSVKESM
jgi:hypothetical protein